MRELATRSDALPLSNQSTYRGYAGKKARVRAPRAAGERNGHHPPRGGWGASARRGPDGAPVAQDSSTWDADLSIGCHCDSAWPVGLGPGETQAPEWFDAACSSRALCPPRARLRYACILLYLVPLTLKNTL